MNLVTALLAVLMIPPTSWDFRDDNVSHVVTFAYPAHFHGTVDLWPTTRNPRAHGKVRVSRECGSVVALDVRLDDILPVQDFGAEFTSYVVWLVDADGKVENMGELKVCGDE